MNRPSKSTYLAILGLSILTLFLSGNAASADLSASSLRSLQEVTAQQTIGEYNFHERIAIFYSGDELITSTAASIYASLHLVYLSTDAYQVKNPSQISTVLSGRQYITAIYLFESNLDEVKVGTTSMEWDAFGELLSHHSYTDHIVGFGNSLNIEKYVHKYPNVNVQGTEVVDANLAYLYSLWTTAELLKKYGGKFAAVGEDLTKLGLKYYAEHFNDLFDYFITRFLFGSISPPRRCNKRYPRQFFKYIS